MVRSLTVDLLVMAYSDIFSALGGAVAITANIYMTYTILAPGCNFSSFFVVLQVLVSVLFFVYAGMIVYESGGALGIGYFVFQVLFLLGAILNFYLILNPVCVPSRWRAALYSGLQSVGKIVYPITGVVESQLPTCPLPC